MTIAELPDPPDFPLPDVGSLNMEPISAVSQADLSGIPLQKLWSEPNERLVISAHHVTKEQAETIRDFWLEDLKRGSLPFTVPWLKGRNLSDVTNLTEYETSEGTRYGYPEGGSSSLDYNRSGFTGWESVCLFTEVPRAIQSNKSNYKLLVELRFRATFQRT